MDGRLTPIAYFFIWIKQVFCTKLLLQLITESPTPGEFQRRCNQYLRQLTRVISGLLLLCLGCIDPYTPDLLSIDYGILVVDGFFVPNDTTRIRLSRTVTMDSPPHSVPEPAAAVKIEGDNGFSMTLSQQKDHVYTAPPIKVDLTAQYKMIIHTADGKTYESMFVRVNASPPIDSVIIHEESDSIGVTFNVFANNPKNDARARYYSYQYDETWEYTASGYSIYKFENDEIVPRRRADELFVCYQSRSSSDIRLTSTAHLSQDVVYDFPILKMRQSDRRLYQTYSLNARQYVLTPEAYAYWSIINQNSEQLGTLFDPIPSQPIGNFTCTTDQNQPVIGYFTASDVATKRILVKRAELGGPKEPYQPTGYEKCVLSFIAVEDVSAENLQGLLINESVNEDVTSEIVGYKVGPAFCLDCRMMGGTTKRPSYWR
jgi:hypothetical protein